MIVILCLDNDNGMMFNNRRQSRDSILYKDIINECGTKPLHLNEYSRSLFQEKSNLIISNDFLSQASKDDYCFVENTDITEYIELVEKLIVYRWNRDYPSDMVFPTDILASRFKLESSNDFVGSSHDKITKEVYTI